MFPGPTCPATPGAAKCPEPLCTCQVLPRTSWCLAPGQWALPHLHRSYGLMRQSSPLLMPRWYPQHQVCAGCCQPLLGEGPSRRCLCASFPACLDPYPGGSCGAHTRFFPHDNGLPPVRTGSALHHVRTATSVRRVFRGCSHSLMFRPAGLLTTPVAPTATDTSVWQPWFLRPSISWVVTFPRPGYACRPNRAIDGRGLSPHKMRSLVGCSPNATRQARSPERRRSVSSLYDQIRVIGGWPC